MSNVNMKELVKNAPEGATHYGAESDYAIDSYYKLDGKSVFIHGVWTSTNSGRCDLVKLDLNINTNDIAKEDGVSLRPMVGDVVMGKMPSRGEWEKVRVIAHEGDSFVVIKGESTLAWCDTFAPIDTRTDQEKLIDEILHETDELNCEEWGNYLNDNFNITRKD